LQPKSSRTFTVKYLFLLLRQQIGLSQMNKADVGYTVILRAVFELPVHTLERVVDGDIDQPPHRAQRALQVKTT